VPYKDPQKRREKAREYSSTYRSKNPERHRSAVRRWRESNPEAVVEKNKLFREANPDYSKRWHRSVAKPQGQRVATVIVKTFLRLPPEFHKRYALRVLDKAVWSSGHRYAVGTSRVDAFLADAIDG